MSLILYQYEKVNPTSWAYLSSLLLLALFFKFNRVFSVRNLDLFILISIAPGLLLIQYSYENEGLRENAIDAQRLGFFWMFAVHGVIMLRLLLDSAMVRRPLLEPNLNSAGLAFLGSSLLFFLMANVVNGKVTPSDWSPALPAAEKAELDVQPNNLNGEPDLFETEGPGYWLLYLLPRISTQTVIQGGEAQPETPSDRARQQQEIVETTARVVAILSHLFIVSGVVLVGARHFDNAAAGIAVATSYLLLPYTAWWTGSVEHALPAALLVWAIVFYRRPLLSGMMIGLASGTIYYPVFLLPLWCSFYWERGMKRFLTGWLLTIGVLVITLAVTAGDFDRFFAHLSQMFGWRLPLRENLQGVWRNLPGFWNPYYRLPILFGYGALALSFAAWPIRKHLGMLICCTAALMVGAQFWHAHGGGKYVAWYLPLFLLTIFRPNLEDRVAIAMVAEGWWQRRKKAQTATATA